MTATRSPAPATSAPVTSTTGAPDRARRHAIVERIVLGAAVLLVLASIATAGLRGIDRWRPVSDNARIAVEAADVGSGELPLLGVPSTSLETVSGVRPIHHPGPAEAYVLGLWQIVWPGPTGLLVGAFSIAGVAGLASLFAARALAGPLGVLLVGALCGLTVSRLGTTIIADIWNPYVPILPFFGGALCAMAYFTSRWRPGLPLAVLLVSFAAQAHLTNGAVLLAVLLPSLGVAVASRARRPDHLSLPRWPAWTALAVGVAMWLPPLMSEVAGGPSNVGNLVRGIRGGPGGATLGAGHALGALRETVATPPPWGPPTIVATLWPPSMSSLVADLAWCLVAAVPLVVLSAWALRVGSWRWAAVGIGPLLGEVVAFAMLASARFLSGFATYQVRWLWALAALHWSATGLLALRWVQRRPASGRRTAPSRRPARGQLEGAVVYLLLIVVSVASVVASGSPPRSATTNPPGLGLYMRTVDDLTPGAAAFVDEQGGAQVLVDDRSGLSNLGLDLAAQLLLLDQPITVTSRDQGRRNYFGPHHATTSDVAPELRVTPLANAPELRRQGFSVVARTAALTAAERRRLARATAALRTSFDDADPRWSGYGAFVHGGDRPELAQLMADNALAEVVFGGTIEGWSPDDGVLREFSELRRRSGDRAVAVWARR